MAGAREDVAGRLDEDRQDAACSARCGDAGVCLREQHSMCADRAVVVGVSLPGTAFVFTKSVDGSVHWRLFAIERGREGWGYPRGVEVSG